MGWQESCVEEEKLRFVAAWLSGEWSRTELCARFGVSRETGYELMRRYRLEGVSCVQARSHARHEQGEATPARLVQAIVDLRVSRPHWGPKKLQACLEHRHPEEAWPAASTIGDIVKRHGLVVGRRRRRSALVQHRPFAAVNAANALWCVDFKGWFRTGDGERCDPLTVTDAASRYLLACVIVPPTRAGVQPVMDGLFREHGLPGAIRSDNGPPFGSTGAGGLTRLGVHWLKLGIALERIEPGQPQQNGRHERMHGTLKAETLRPPAATAAKQQDRFDRFREMFNQERPHEALRQTVPSKHWQASARLYPDPIEAPTYGADHVVRRVRSNGEIKWRGGLIFLSEVLAGERVGIAETETGEHIVRFAGLDLGLINRAGTKLRRFTAPRPGRREADPQPTSKSVNHVAGP
jgi:transposase InsO family protein